MKTASELVTVIAASSRDVENWVARLGKNRQLFTKYQKTKQGSARLYSRENALELAFIAALVRGGATPSRAAVFAQSFLRHEFYATAPLRAWFAFPAGQLDAGIASNAPTAGELENLGKRFNTTTLSFVHVREIVRRVNALYGAD